MKTKKQHLKQVVINKIAEEFSGIDVRIEGFEKKCVLATFDNFIQSIDLTLKEVVALINEKEGFYDECCLAVMNELKKEIEG